MGCGVLETREKNVPGTALLTDDDPLASLRAYGEDIDVSDNVAKSNIRPYESQLTSLMHSHSSQSSNMAKARTLISF